MIGASSGGSGVVFIIVIAFLVLYLIDLVAAARKAIERGAFETWRADALTRLTRLPLET